MIKRQIRDRKGPQCITAGCLCGIELHIRHLTSNNVRSAQNRCFKWRWASANKCIPLSRTSAGTKTLITIFIHSITHNEEKKQKRQRKIIPKVQMKPLKFNVEGRCIFCPHIGTRGTRDWFTSTLTAIMSHRVGQQIRFFHTYYLSIESKCVQSG